MSQTLEKTMNVLQARQLLRDTSRVADDRVSEAERTVRAFFAAKPKRQCFACPSGIWSEHETKAGDDVCWACARCHVSADLTRDEIGDQQAERRVAQQAAQDTAAKAAKAAAATQPKPRAVLRERLAALAACRSELARLEKAAPAARSRVWDLQAKLEAAETAAETANEGAASSLADALATGKPIGPASGAAAARAALAEARDALQVAKSARILVEERLQAAKSQVDFAFDKCRMAARSVIAAERMEDLIGDAVEARAAYVDALGSLAWLVQQHAVPDGDSRVRQLVADGNTPPSAWPEAKIAGIKVMQDAFEALMLDAAAVI
jgi:hypothetical protein